MRKFLHIIFGKPKYYYDPRLGKGEGDDALYMTTIYKYWMGKRRPVVAYADKDPLKVMDMVRFYVDYVNKK